ncbi:MAG: hypothetical protein QOD07_1186 [Frankiaceae bacterium]|jgi:short subunit dehydrogenase-like uncharacterized protein|nr:hypothetical protein [Frankiaceae bacterium]
MTRNEREFDLVLYGASGFVGKLTAEHLAATAPDGARIALAGRSAAKLDAVRSSLPEPARQWPTLTADANDPAALTALARRTTAVATTVGPYLAYGVPLVEACAEAGTHYADLTGEVLFMRRTADKLHDVAASSGARIVHACGFDSVPSDLGVALLHELAGDDALTDTTLAVTDLRGGLSGGTFDSMRRTLAEVASDPEAARILDDPYALSPARELEPDKAKPGWGSERDLRGIVHDGDLDAWLAPFVMAPSNTRVVRRTNALLDWTYGREFRYREVMAFRGPVAPVAAAGLTAGLAGFVGLMSTAPTRAVLDRLLPKPGEGPSEKTRRNGRFRIEITSRTASGRRLRAVVAATGDPGYAATAVMFGQSALALAFDGEQLPPRAGVLTPATAIGQPLVDRLRTQGFTLTAADA